MGLHYVPARYLRYFQCESHPGCIWMFDSKANKADRVPIKVAAQKPQFYSREVESWLEREIERPGGAVIEKLVREEAISPEEQLAFARYVAGMFVRVPEKRARITDGLPAAMDKTRGQLPEHLQRIGKEKGLSEEEIDYAISQIGPLTEALLARPPKELTDFIDDAEPVAECVEAICRMNWMIVRCPPSMSFITSDNPGFFVPDMLLEHAESEVFLPLSPRFAFHGCYEKRRGKIGYVSGLPASAVTEFNRRTARQATRFCFSHERADWTLRLMGKRHRLRAIRFPGPISPNAQR